MSTWSTRNARRRARLARESDRANRAVYPKILRQLLSASHQERADPAELVNMRMEVLNVALKLRELATRELAGTLKFTLLPRLWPHR